MVAFRKLFYVLAIAALLLGSSTTASAQTTVQTPLACIANAGVPPIVRAEGATELVGDIVLVCTGGNPGAAFLANFQVFLNTNITSRLLATDLSEALLLIDEPLVPRATGGPTPLCLAPVGANSSNNGTALTPIVGLPTTSVSPPTTCNPGTVTPVGGFQVGTYTAFRANTTSQFNAVVWPGVPVVPPGTTGTRTFRFTNIRANASVIGPSSGLIPNQITAFLSVSASQSVAINNPQQTVAYVQTGLLFDVRNCGNTGGASNPSLAQCVNFNPDVFDNPNRSTATGATVALRFREGFQTAFKTRIDTTAAPNPQTDSVPGVVYNTESGFVRTTASPGSDVFGIVGVANSATRVAARFRNIPAGVKIFVTVTNQIVTGAQAVLVQTGPNGEGGTTGVGVGSTVFPIGGTTNISCSGIVASAAPNAAEVAITGGTGVAVWEVVAANPAVIDELVFWVTVAFRANAAAGTPTAGQTTVSGTFAPFYSDANNVASASGRWSTALPVPRFQETTTTTNDFRIDACQTNLLFPFVTAQAGFDTGIAISNTSQDPFPNPANRAQSGTCTLNYFGNVTGGGNAPNPQTTNAAVPAGGQLLFVLSSGGNFGIAGVPNFQGYIFARCLFRYAHGFAFITDGPIGQARVAEGYLALVVTTDPFDADRGSAAESLAH